MRSRRGGMERVEKKPGGGSTRPSAILVCPRPAVPGFHLSHATIPSTPPSSCFGKGLLCFAPRSKAVPRRPNSPSSSLTFKINCS